MRICVLLVVILALVCDAVHVRKQYVKKHHALSLSIVDRVFTPKLIPGTYQRNLVLPGAQCPASFQFNAVQNGDGAVLVRYRDVLIAGQKCTNQGSIRLLPLDSAIERPEFIAILSKFYLVSYFN